MDNLTESLTIQRIDMIARLVADERCTNDDRELAVCWIAELTTGLLLQEVPSPDSDARLN